MGDIYYSTANELQFLDGIGSWSKRFSMSRKDLLANYIKASKNRAWPKGVDGDDVLGYAQQLLLQESQ